MSMAKEELDKIHELRMTGKITQSEYEKRKKVIINYYSSPEMRMVQQEPATVAPHSIRVISARPSRKGLGLLLFVGLMSWCFAWTITAGGTKTDVAGQFNLPMGGLAVLLFFVGILYMLPTFIAGLRRHPHYMGIAVVNLLLATTGIVWIACLVWAFISPARAGQTVIVQSTTK